MSDFRLSLTYSYIHSSNKPWRRQSENSREREVLVGFVVAEVNALNRDTSLHLQNGVLYDLGLL